MKRNAHWVKVVVGVALLAVGQPVAAQNSDLGFLFGVSTKGEVRNGVLRGETSASMQINYAWQFHENRAGRFYVELPFLLSGSSRGEIGRQVSGVTGVTLFVTPGVRYHYNLTPRVAVYAAAGIGAAIANEHVGVVGSGKVAGFEQTRASLAGDVGGGLDFRLTRLWSLRGEIRDFISSRSAVLPRRNNVAIQFGFALHF